MAISQPDTDGIVTSSERLPETGWRLFPRQACLPSLINIPPRKLTAKKPIPGGIAPPACHLASHSPVGVSLCCLTAPPGLAGTDQPISKEPPSALIPMGRVERADRPGNAGGGLVVVPGSQGGAAETQVLWKGVPD